MLLHEFACRVSVICLVFFLILVVPIFITLHLKSYYEGGTSSVTTIRTRSVEKKLYLTLIQHSKINTITCKCYHGHISIQFVCFFFKPGLCTDQHIIFTILALCVSAEIEVVLLL